MAATMYRADDGCTRHPAGRTLLDILTYEEEELGNEGAINQGRMSGVPLDTPANQCKWVCWSREDVERYHKNEGGDIIAEVEEIVAEEGTWRYVIIDDGDGGSLVAFSQP